MITVYGIKTCDTVRKALKWLESEGVEHRFHDFRKDGLDADQVQRWAAALGWESVLNKRSTTWKQLADADKTDLNEAKAVALMTANPTLIKRPVFELKDKVLQGFTDAVKDQIN